MQVFPKFYQYFPDSKAAASIAKSLFWRAWFGLTIQQRLRSLNSLGESAYRPGGAPLSDEWPLRLLLFRNLLLVSCQRVDGPPIPTPTLPLKGRESVQRVDPVVECRE